MKKQLLGLALMAAAMLATIFSIAPHSDITTNAASTEIVGIDILGLTKSAKDLPDHQYAAH